tara:strand:+ start:1122 stop:3065 length:1944 start_codon:yes stop_codon:yes gene_type:complete
MNLLDKISKHTSSIGNSIINSKEFVRRLILILVDSFLIAISARISFLILKDSILLESYSIYSYFIVLSIVIGIPIYLFTGQYKALTKYVGSRAMYLLGARNALIVFITSIFGRLFTDNILSSRFLILNWIFLSVLIGLFRFSLRDLLLSIQPGKQVSATNIAIYGAGTTGAQLAKSIRINGGYKLITFLDDSPKLWNRNINGIPIKSPYDIKNFHEEIDQVLVAIPSIKRKRLREIMDNLQNFSFSILQIPSIEDLTEGRARIDTLRPISIEDLLCRDSVLPDKQLISENISNQVICVTGAGGSIGSELCREMIKLRVKKILLIENHEPSLYKIFEELKPKVYKNIEIIPILGNCFDKSHISKIFKAHKVNSVFHAAAYKHVPIVELNPLQGLMNNVISTKVLCSSAQECGVNRLILISTDKAVRPTNVMGASKRLAELVVQSFAEHSTNRDIERSSKSTCFSMVRFGNVLGSSGSVVPLFRQQISTGGPITLTHPEMVRYFMTIKEAAQLVLQASNLANGGEIFLLDMGNPVRIQDLAIQMIKLSGLSVCDENNPNGDIEIICTGKRPGEKLYEELLIDSTAEATRHPLIFKAKENYIKKSILFDELDKLDLLFKDHKTSEALKILSNLVPEWKDQQNKVNDIPMN